MTPELQGRVEQRIGRAALHLLETHHGAKKLTEFERRTLGRDLLTAIGGHLAGAGYPNAGAAVARAKAEIAL